MQTARPSLFPRLVESGQQHRGENADNGDDDKKFDQREGGRVLPVFHEK